MKRSFWIWVLWFSFLFTLDFIVPFSVLSDIPRLSGSFLFWIVWIIVAITSMFIIVIRWREDDTQGAGR